MNHQSKVNLEEFASLIPLRGGSKGIPKKNTVLLREKPLFWYVTNASINVGLKTYISTESKEIKSLSQKNFKSISVIDRPDQYAQDHSTTEEVINHFLKSINVPKHIVLLQATSPLTSSLDIKKSIQQYVDNDFIPLVSVVHEHSFYWNKEGRPINYNPIQRPRRQDWDGLYKENGAIYIFSRTHFEKYKCRAAGKSNLYEMSRKS